MNATDVRSELGARFDDPDDRLRHATLLLERALPGRTTLSEIHRLAPRLKHFRRHFTVYGAPMPQNSALTSAGAELFITPR